MARPYEVVTFDCYGTLVDWEGGIADAFAEAAAADGMTLPRDALLATYLAVEREVEARAYRSYRAILTETAQLVAGRLGWRIDEKRAAFLPESLARWRPFPDTNAALERLARAGYTLGILSNVDDDLLAGTRRHLTVDIPLIVTAQQVGSYKPAAGHFVTARARIAGRPWLHAAQSYFHDVTPAVAHKIPVAWINRHNQPPAGAARPDREFPTLAALAGWLA